MMRRLSIGKTNHLTCYSLAINPQISELGPVKKKHYKIDDNKADYAYVKLHLVLYTYHNLIDIKGNQLSVQ